MLGLGIFVFVDMSPANGGSMVMAFAHVFGEATRPSLFKAAMFMVISGVAIIIYGVTSMLSVWKKSYKLMALVRLPRCVNPFHRTDSKRYKIFLRVLVTSWDSRSPLIFL